MTDEIHPSRVDGWLVGVAVGAMALVAFDALSATQLVIRSGLVRWRIAYADITGVEPSRSLWSAPALSLRRVGVRYAGRFQLVSPRDRERFITALNGRVRAVRRQAT